MKQINRWIRIISTNTIKIRIRGLTIAEVAVAVAVIAICLSSLLWLLMSSRSDTSKAINYLRAIELANEAIDWISVAPFYRKDITNDVVKQIGGSIVTSSGAGTYHAAPLDVIPSSRNDWMSENLIAKNLSYSEQYTNAFFYRTIDIEDVPNTPKGYLRKVTVTVEWAEGTIPQHLDQPGGERKKKIVLTTLILNEKQPVY